MASTGPRSPEGKRRVSQNARKHGFRSQNIILTPHQRAEIEANVQSFAADFPHLNQQHAAVFLQLGTAWWYLQHFDKLEDECYKITDIEDVVCHLFTLTRYRARHERLFHQAMATLQTLLANCTIKPNPPVKPEELTQNPFYPIHPIHPSQESFFSGATNPQRSAHGAPTPQINSAICTIKPNPPVKPEKLTQNPFYPIHPSQDSFSFGAANPPAQPAQICTIKPTELPETILRTNVYLKRMHTEKQTAQSRRRQIRTEHSQNRTPLT